MLIALCTFCISVRSRVLSRPVHPAIFMAGVTSLIFTRGHKDDYAYKGVYTNKLSSSNVFHFPIFSLADPINILLLLLIQFKPIQDFWQKLTP